MTETPWQISLREHIELQIHNLEVRMSLLLAEKEKALVLQAEEYGRRLAVLNHAHEEARQKEHDFVGRDAYETAYQSLVSRLERLEMAMGTTVDRDRLENALRTVSQRYEEVATRMNSMERLRANLDGRLSMLGLVLFGLSIVVNILITLFARVWGGH